MRAVIQRVSSASVIANGVLTGEIKKGFVVLVGIEQEDDNTDAEWLAEKVSTMRIFQDSDDKMNLALEDVDGEVLIVSQFTLHASTRKGNRPSFIRAARPDHAVPLYEYFITHMTHKTGKPVAAGIFGADMKVSLINDGPVTIIMDSKNKDY